MAFIKCKMCGGELKITESSTICECEYCGSKQTVPKLDDEKKLKLFERANRLRTACEFDKAAGVYESLVADFDQEAEAYWGLILCKFGIEYVDDPATGKKIPTCHRSSFDSLMDDPNFEMVMECADPIARRVYREEAKTIEELRKRIIELSAKEEPYDVFISYKELDDNGERTLDSVIAQDIYTELTEKGYRVFFSRISLESKLGVEYEPYIFAALNSAKVMIVVGSDYDYFNAVWVKNEWSRFLTLIASGHKKTLIPVFKDIDAYDMPKEFAKLAAQDMGKVGAMQDLIRGVEKLIGKKADNTVTGAYHAVSQGTSPSAESLLDRAFVFLEDQEWEKAAEYADKVLDINVRNGNAYLVKLMSDLQVKQIDDLVKQKDSFAEHPQYIKIKRFGDKGLNDRISSFLEKIDERKYNEKYKLAVRVMLRAKVEDDYDEAIQLFSDIYQYKDSSSRLEKCELLKNELIEKHAITEAKEKIESTYNELELDEVIEEIGESRDIAEIANLINDTKRNHEEWLSKASELWENYVAHAKIIIDFERTQQSSLGKRNEQYNRLEHLKHELDRSRQIVDDAHNIEEEIVLAKDHRDKLDALVRKAQTELSGLGIFAVSAKKEMNARINDLHNQIRQNKSTLETLQKKRETIQRELDSLRSKEEIARDIEEVEEYINKDTTDEKSLADEYQNAKAKYNEEIESIAHPRCLAALLSTSDEALYTAIFEDVNLVARIRSNDRLLYIAQRSHFYNESFVNRIKAKRISSNFKSREVGDEIRFGSYYMQEGRREAIIWKILAKEKDRILLISKLGIDCQPYHNRNTKVTWEKSSLRTWLNGLFLNTAFDEDEQTIIPIVNVSANINPIYDTDPGNTTKDKIFLLSITEAKKYFANDKERECMPTEYAQSHGCYETHGTCWWWLRTPGENPFNASLVGNNGSVIECGDVASYSTSAVRPVMWVNV